MLTAFDVAICFRESSLMYANFSELAGKAFVLADQETRRLKHEYIGTEHLLLGLMKVSRGVAVEVLRRHSIQLDRVEASIERIVPIGDVRVAADACPRTPRVKRCLEYSLEEARSSGQDLIGTGHILLGLLCDQECVAAQILDAFGLSLDDARKEVQNVLSQGIDE